MESHHNHHDHDPVPEPEGANLHDSGHSAHSGMMMMYFHGGYNEVILFESWQISTVGGLIGSMIACFILAVMYEALKFYRDFIMRWNFKRVHAAAAASATVTPHPTTDKNSPSDLPNNDQGTMDGMRVVETKMLSKGHFLLTLLHMAQVCLAYLLMLIVMTYNTWLCLAVLFGATVGYFAFGWRKSVFIDVSDHCH